MKVLYYIGLTALLFSCRVSEIGSNEQTSSPREVVITADRDLTDQSTKTVIVGTNARWSITDALELFDDAKMATKGAKFALISGDNQRSAMFKGTFVDGAQTKRNVYAVYPYQAGKLEADNKTYTFSIPSVQAQNTEKDSLSIGRYTYMVARPVNSTPDEVEISLDQLMSIIDFKVVNFPEDKMITKLVIKATQDQQKPFLTSGGLDMTIDASSATYGKIKGATFSNAFTLMLSNISTANFTTSIVVFPFEVNSADLQIIVTTIDAADSKSKTYTFNKDNVDLTIFGRGKRVPTTLDFSGKSPDEAIVEAYSVWDGTTITEPELYDQGRKVISIARASDLAWLAQQTNLNVNNGFEDYTVTQTTNIDLGGMFDGAKWSGVNWTPIGSGGDKSFNGNYNGSGYNIRNLYCNIGGAGSFYAGLFGLVGGSKIENVNIETGYVAANATSSMEYAQSPYAYAGGVCAVVKSARQFTLSNCINGAYVYSSGSVMPPYGSAAFYFSGGVVGLIESKEKVIVRDCINNGVVDGEISALASNGVTAGICAQVKSSAEITNCVNNNIVLGAQNSAGICGKISSDVNVTNCINNANIESTQNLGGICSEVSGNLNMINCLNNGNLDSGRAAGMVVSCSTDAQNVTIVNCINKGEIIGQARDKGLGEAAGIIAVTNAKNIIIENCVNQAEIHAVGVTAYAAGICLTVENSKIRILKCRNFSDIESSANRGTDIGGIVCKVDNSVIEILECENQGLLVTNASSIIGGIVGSINESFGRISDCTNNGVIRANSIEPSCFRSVAGGICGSINSTSSNFLIIDNCVNYGNTQAYTTPGRLYATRAYASGICGEIYAQSNSVYLVRNLNAANIEATAEKGEKDAKSAAGGICALSNNVTLINCVMHETAQSTDLSKSGLLVGEADNTVITACYSTINHASAIAGFVGAVKTNVSIYDSYHGSENAIITNAASAKISGGGAFAQDNWPTSSVAGWGDTMPIGWNDSALGTWKNPWASLGAWDEQLTNYPELK